LTNIFELNKHYEYYSFNIICLFLIIKAITIERGGTMGNSLYKIIELVGTSSTSWEDAAKSAVESAAKTLREVRVAEIDRLDVKLENGKVTTYRARVKLSFKYLT